MTMESSEIVPWGGAVSGEIQSQSPEWLRRIRDRSWQAFCLKGLPTTNLEEWKYTSLKKLAGWSLTEAPDSILSESAASAHPLWGLDAFRVVFVNGSYQAQLSNLPSDLEGVSFASQNCADPSKSNWLEDVLGRVAVDDEAALMNCNTAIFRDLAALRISTGPSRKPIHVAHIHDAKQPGSAMQARLAVVVEKDANAFVIESYWSASCTSSWTNAVTEITVETGGKLEHVKVQLENTDSIHTAWTQVRQEPGSAYEHYNVNFGASIARNDINVWLGGADCHSRMDGVIVLEDSQHCDNHTRLDHAFPHCDSFEVYKHVLDGRSVAVFNGKIFVHQDAQKTDAKQTNQTLLLSPTATVNTKPQLEIFADDVKCTHGATIGQVRKDAMFYLRTRGIPEPEARSLMVYAFAAEVLERIEIDEVRLALEELLYKKLGTEGD